MEKVTKTAVHYQSQPKNGKRCARCTMWRPPSSCSYVKGDISPQGYCEAFKAKGALSTAEKTP